MNAIFITLFILGGLILLFVSPDKFLPSMLSAGEKAGAVCLSLIASYSVWLGFMQVITDCRLTDKLSRALKPLTKKLFRTDEGETLSALATNISANVLGLGGIATPYGIRAASLLEGRKQEKRAHAILMVLASTSLQLIPTTAVSLLSMHGSANPYSVILPTLLSSAVCTLTGLTLVMLIYRK